MVFCRGVHVELAWDTLLDSVRDSCFHGGEVVSFSQRQEYPLGRQVSSERSLMLCVCDHVDKYSRKHYCGRPDLISLWVVLPGREYADQYALSHVKMFGNLIRLCQSFDLVAVLILLLQLSKVRQ